MLDAAITFALDLARMATIFALGLAVSLEVTVVRYTHQAIHAPDGRLYFVPMTAQVLRAVSRLAAVMFIAIELHERFGQPITWRVPAGAFIAATSAASTIVTARNRLTGKVG